MEIERDARSATVPRVVSRGRCSQIRTVLTLSSMAVHAPDGKLLSRLDIRSQILTNGTSITDATTTAMGFGQTFM